MASGPAQGQEDVAAPAGPAVGRRSFDDLEADPRGSHALLGTATKLARGLRELRDDADTPQYLGLVASGSTNPTARVEYALRADELTEAQVRQIMEYYLAVRMRRYGRTFAEGSSTGGSGERPRDRQMGSSGQTGSMSGRPMGVTGMNSTVRSVSTGGAVSTVRTVTRSSGREPGRY